MERRALIAARVFIVPVAAAGLLSASSLAVAGPPAPTQIVASDGTVEHRFGYAVSIDAGRMLVGALLDSDSVMWAGSAYVFRLEGTQWVEEAELFDPDPMVAGHLGTSVAIAGNFAVVGARAVADYPLVGGAMIFAHSAGAWTHVVTLTPPDITPPTTAGAYLGFGHAVAIDGDRVVVTMPQDDIACPADPLCNSGSAYVFRREGEAWVLEQKLIPSDPQRIAHFGRSASIAGDRIVVGAFQADSVAGAAYVYRREGATWVEEAKLTNPDAEPSVVAQFGESVSIDGGAIAVGAPGENHAGSYSGATYIYRLGAGTWAMERKLTADDAVTVHFFGQSVSIRGGRVLVGAPWDNRGGALFRAGAAYLFELGGSGWVQRAKLTDPNGQNEDFFGWSVATNGDVALVGAQRANRPDPDSGAIFVYGLGASCPADWNGDEVVNSSDISAFLTAWLASILAPNLDADFNDDGATNSSDISAFLTAWLAALQGGC